MDPTGPKARGCLAIGLGIFIILVLADLNNKQKPSPASPVSSPATEPTKAIIKAITFIVNNRNAGLPKELWGKAKRRTKVVAYMDAEDTFRVSLEDLVTHQTKIQHMSVKAYRAMYAVLAIDGYLEPGTLKDEYINP